MEIYQNKRKEIEIEDQEGNKIQQEGPAGESGR